MRLGSVGVMDRGDASRSSSCPDLNTIGAREWHDGSFSDFAATSPSTSCDSTPLVYATSSVHQRRLHHQRGCRKEFQLPGPQPQHRRRTGSGVPEVLVTAMQKPVPRCHSSLPRRRDNPLPTNAAWLGRAAPRRRREELERPRKAHDGLEVLEEALEVPQRGSSSW